MNGWLSSNVLLAEYTTFKQGILRFQSVPGQDLWCTSTKRADNAPTYYKEEGLGRSIRADISTEGYSEQNHQAGLCIYDDPEHWVKCGVEYKDGELMVIAVFTSPSSISFWFPLSKALDGRRLDFVTIELSSCKSGQIICKLSLDGGATWSPISEGYLGSPSRVRYGVMAASPERLPFTACFKNIKLH